MTPERKAASRLGWVVVGTATIVLFLIVRLAFCLPMWWERLILGLVVGAAQIAAEPASYSLLSAPERETKPEVKTVFYP